MPIEFAHELVSLVSRHDAYADGKVSWKEQLPSILKRAGKGPACGAVVSLPLGSGRHAFLEIEVTGYPEYPPLNRSLFRDELAELLKRHSRRLSRAGVNCKAEISRESGSLKLVIAGTDGGMMIRMRKILAQLSNAPARRS